MVINTILNVTNLNKIVVNVKILDITYALNILCVVKKLNKFIFVLYSYFSW